MPHSSFLARLTEDGAEARWVDHRILAFEAFLRQMGYFPLDEILPRAPYGTAPAVDLLGWFWLEQPKLAAAERELVRQHAIEIGRVGFLHIAERTDG